MKKGVIKVHIPHYKGVTNINESNDILINQGLLNLRPLYGQKLCQYCS